MIITLWATILFSTAQADTWTGVVQAIRETSSQCSAPPQEMPVGFETTQVSSQFTYWGCKEYRASTSKEIYYRVELANDGEYIHLLPRPGSTTVAAEEYKKSSAVALSTCEQIRQRVIKSAISVDETKCRGLNLD